jgi:hypothetical protein
MSASGKGTTDRESKLQDLKKSLAWSCCETYLTPPLSYVGPLVFAKGDSEQVKNAKRLENKQKLRYREQERIRREPEVVHELEKVMERVVAARPEYAANKINYAAITDSFAGKTTKFRCERCGNSVRLRVQISTLTSNSTVMIPALCRLHRLLCITDALVYLFVYIGLSASYHR